MKFTDKKIIKNKCKDYMQIYGMSRYEEKVVDYLKASVQNTGLEYQRDALGSIVYHKPTKQANAPKVLIDAHMDEVGYVVSEITDEGMLLISAMGGIWPNVVIGTPVKLVVKDNAMINGVVGHTSIHILEADKRKAAYEANDLYVDAGFKNKQEALDMGIKAGSLVYLANTDIDFVNDDLVVGKAVDNRVSCAVIDLLINELAKKELAVDAYFSLTAQEEVGTRGAKTTVSLINPDVAIILDTTASHDTYKAIKGTTRLGEGIAFRIKDSETLANPRLLAYFEELASQKNIPCYRYVAKGGGTNAAEMQYSPAGGSIILGLSIPQRYLHAPIGVSDVKDIQAAANLIYEFLVNFNAQKFSEIRYN
ncbi:M42 family metallopeptidase [Ureaplasma miroungigenitalium]|uniref:M42 family metallopeptidase n=1 Tax=Ureaplasma miroungigenitalium TaxID=1042321 RepID=A0ABT3BMX7_9BACT|nr:M42 family metallopeptidase [Ureaplasma miroungigenitalium]MCV3728580.1 M42 family metallopeptidase [Ureaplasma miroungigenitalium]MCV3734413.1 M42 family metallopeptidase [Ureaplasma miroungigenitalium]